MKKPLLQSLIMPISLLALIFACFACAKEKNIDYSQYNNSPVTDTTSKKDNWTGGSVVSPLQYLALGDSYTIGQSVAESDRFPAQTVRLLAAEAININPVNYIATTGWTTTNLINSISYEHPPHNFDIVTLLIGVNDQYQRMDTAGYRVHFTKLLNTAVTLAANRPTRVFVVSIPDYSATPFVTTADKARVSKEVDEFNAINKEVTIQQKIAYIDITPASRQAAIDPTLTAGDDLHPSGKQYATWAALIAPFIKNALK